MLLHGATVKNGRITLRSGASYAVLVLPPEDADMTPAMLECIGKLVRAGATVVGQRPQHSPSLADYPRCDAQVQKLANTIWGKCDGTTVLENTYGKGRVVWGKSLADVLASLKVKPDFEISGQRRASQLAYAHRVAGQAEIYFVSNQRRQFESAACTFRVSGKAPELWHPDSGTIEPAPIWKTEDGRTTVQLDLDPAGSAFVIFRQPAGTADHLVAAVGDFKSAEKAEPAVEIKHAVYVAQDGAGEMDVSAMLSEMVRDGHWDVAVDNETFGRDPARNHVKELRVDYTIDGKPMRAVVAEGESFNLPASGPAAAPPWEIRTDAAGSPIVKAWENGRVEMRTQKGTRLQADAANVPAPAPVSGEWKLSFPPDWGAPASVTLSDLISWPAHTNEGVRYFSGTATYEKEIEVECGPVERRTRTVAGPGSSKEFRGGVAERP